MSSPSSTSRRTFFGLWTDSKASSSTSADLESQVASSSNIPSSPLALSTLPTAYIASHRGSIPSHAAESEEETEDAVDLFFGCSRPRPAVQQGTHASQHDVDPIPISSRASFTPSIASPPPYSRDLELGLPSYEQSLTSNVPEPVTLAKYFFKFGFIFPPFWFLGTLILFSSLQAPADWEPTKTPEERASLVHAFRKAEIRWAKRCFFAMIGLILVVAVVVAAALTIVRMT